VISSLLRTYIALGLNACSISDEEKSLDGFGTWCQSYESIFSSSLLLWINNFEPGIALSLIRIY
jgi:hypothetical protein